MKAPPFAYARPSTLAEAYELLETHGEEARLLAGGQSLMPALNMRLAAPLVLIDINGLHELVGIEVRESTLAIRAMTRHRALEHSPDVARHLPLLYQAMPNIAHAAIRNRGTFGGSIALADPAAELPACSLALGATFVIGNRRGKRSVPASEFFKGLYETALRPGEVLLAAEFARSKPGYRSAFREFARRQGDFAMVGLAGCAKYEHGILSDVRLAFCGVGATPVLANRAADALQGKRFSQETVANAQAALDEDLSSDNEFDRNRAARMHWARVLLQRVCTQLTHASF